MNKASDVKEMKMQGTQGLSVQNSPPIFQNYILTKVKGDSSIKKRKLNLHKTLHNKFMP
jgi:hypothetical protein